MVGLKTICEMEEVSSFDIGIGVQYYSNGDKYSGEWIDNQRNGQGRK